VMERRIVAQFLTCMDGMILSQDTYINSYSQYQSCHGKRRTINQLWSSERQTVQMRWILPSAAQAASTMR
jgi:hypothetical protein